MSPWEEALLAEDQVHARLRERAPAAFPPDDPAHEALEAFVTTDAFILRYASDRGCVRASATPQSPAKSRSADPSSSSAAPL